MFAIDFEKVVKTYQGKDGCACGCRGKYTYTTAGRAVTNATREADTQVPEEKVNDKRVAKIVRYINERYESAGGEHIVGEGDELDIYEVRREGSKNHVYRVYVWRETPTAGTAADPTAPCADEA